MAGYKVVLRILLVLLILGGIGALIFYFVGGSMNTKSAYNSYEKLKNSSSFTYIEKNLSSTSDAVSYLEADQTFEKWYSCYQTQMCVFDELGNSFYFASEKANKSFVDKVNELQKKVDNTQKDLKTFVDAKKEFDENASVDQNHSAEVLSNLAKPLKTNFYAQIVTLSEMNTTFFDFAKKNTIVDSKNLKIKMLELMQKQSNLLLSALQSTNKSNMNFAFADNKASLENYLAEKQSNFALQTSENSTEFLFLLSFDDVDTETQQQFFKAFDKKTFVERSSQKTKLGYVTSLMGWGVY